MKESNRLLKYLLISVAITLLDVAVVSLCRYLIHLPLLWANTLGVVTGAVVQYLLTSRHVFQVEKNPKTLLIFVATFFLGLFLANGTIYLVHRMLLPLVAEKLAFLLAKGASLVVPFFVTYFVRRKLYEVT
ncbi:MAG: GtrA family protein [Tissierellia bacterium]|nr:GtrA family protein [Tissierellia bacterium]